MASFEPFTLQHLMPVLIGIGLFWLLISRTRQLPSAQSRRMIAIVISFAVWGIMFSRTFLKLVDGSFSITEDLPLYMCRLVTWLLPIALILNYRKMLKVLYFWVLGGAFQGTLTPDISHGFPAMEYIGYFAVHIGLIGVMIYITVVQKLRIGWPDFWRAFVIAQFYLLFLIGLNMMMGSNYGYTQVKPSGGSLLDYFGPWPYFLLGAELIMLVSFLVLMVPFLIKKHQHSRTTVSSPGREV